MTLCALIVGIYILVFYPSDPAFLHTSAPAPVHRNPTTHRRERRVGTNPKGEEKARFRFFHVEIETPKSREAIVYIFLARVLRAFSSMDESTLSLLRPHMSTARVPGTYDKV